MVLIFGKWRSLAREKPTAVPDDHTTLPVAYFVLGLLSDHEDGHRLFIRKVGELLPDYTAIQSKDTYQEKCVYADAIYCIQTAKVQKMLCFYINSANIVIMNINTMWFSI
jgi:hypothetical protein